MKQVSIDLAMIGTILRKKNKQQYRLLALCQFLSLLMVTSFSIMMFSHTVLNVLPKGGDSRKQMNMIFAVSLFGCAMFLIYAVGIFFRYKSKEMGVFLALGAKKSQVGSMLTKELLGIGFLSGAAGILLALPLDYLLWGIFGLLVPNSEEMRFSIQWNGYVWGILFFLFTMLLYGWKCKSYVKKTNLIDLIHEEHKTEPIRDVKSWYGWGGVVLMLGGCFFGYISSFFCFRVLKIYPPKWLPVIYGLVPIGLYLFLLYVIIRGVGKKGKYRHIISHSMMKFQGRQTVRNMVVITVLTAAAFFAIFYIPTLGISAMIESVNRPYDYYFHYRQDQNMVTMDEIEKMADQKQVTITKKENAEILTLVRDGYEEDYDENNRQKNTYYSPYCEESVISQSDYNRITGENVKVSPGKFVFVNLSEEIEESEEELAKEISYFMNPVTKKKLSMSVEKGKNADNSLFLKYFIFNDKDYRTIGEGLTPEWKEKMILFNTKNVKDTYPFARALYNKIIKRSGKEVCVFDGYDRIQKIIEEKEQGYYFGDQRKEFQLDYKEKDTTAFTMYWKYYPRFRVMDQQETLTRYAVFFMLFAFIAVIVLASVILIAHTRAISIAVNNKQVYRDVKHLGASRAYLRNSVKNQIFKIFFVPVAIGTAIIYIFYIMILTFNSGTPFISSTELAGLLCDVVVVFIVVGIIYLVYKNTLKKVYKMLEIE